MVASYGFIQVKILKIYLNPLFLMILKTSQFCGNPVWTHSTSDSCCPYLSAGAEVQTLPAGACRRPPSATPRTAAALTDPCAPDPSSRTGSRVALVSELREAERHGELFVKRQRSPCMKLTHVLSPFLEQTWIGQPTEGDTHNKHTILLNSEWNTSILHI